MSFPRKVLQFLLALYGFGAKTWVKKRPGPVYIGHVGRDRLA